MITLEKYIAGVYRGDRSKLANILTRLKMDFGSAFVRGGGPTEVSAYDEIPVDAFDPKSENVYILIEQDAVAIYQPVNKMWQVYNVVNNRLKYVYNTPTPSMPTVFSKNDAVLYCAEITGEGGRETLKMGEKISKGESRKLSNTPAVIRRVGIIKKTVLDPLCKAHGLNFKDQESEWFLDQMVSTKISNADLDLLSNIVGSIAWLVYLYEEGDHQSLVSYVERSFGEYTKVIKRLRSAVKRYGVPPQVEKLVTYCLEFVDGL